MEWRKKKFSTLVDASNCQPRARTPNSFAKCSVRGVRAKKTKNTPENSKRVHLRAPALQTPPKFHVKHKRRRKKEKLWRVRGKKTNFWPPFGAPPHPSGPTPPFGAQYCWAHQKWIGRNWIGQKDWPKFGVGQSRSLPCITGALDSSKEKYIFHRECSFKTQSILESELILGAHRTTKNHRMFFSHHLILLLGIEKILVMIAKFLKKCNSHSHDQHHMQQSQQTQQSICERLMQRDLYDG